MIQETENPVVAVHQHNRVLDSIGFAANIENPTENLIELQADWLLRRYPISPDRARIVASLYFGEAA